MDRGLLHFFKEGNDLGVAFNQPELKEGQFYPFIQIGCKCQLHVFHPFVHPQYQTPPSEESMLRMEEERVEREEEERRERDAEKRRRRRAKAGLDPDGLTEDDGKSKKASSQPPEEEEEEAVVDAYQSSFRNSDEFMMVAPESEAIDDFEYENTLGAAIHNSDLRFEEMSEKLV